LTNKVHVKKGDTVIVLSGKDRYSLTKKKGKVLFVDKDKNQVIVEGVNMSTKHKKPRSRYQQGGIIHQESPIHSSNVMLVCEKCSSPTKVGMKILEDGQKARICKKCGEMLDIVNKKRSE
jgi:large subunit ribosomal protein L24